MALRWNRYRARALARPAARLGRARTHAGPDLLTLGVRPAARARLPQSRAGKSVLVGRSPLHFGLALLVKFGRVGWPESAMRSSRDPVRPGVPLVISFAFATSLGETQIKATGSRAHRVRPRKEDTIAEQTKPFPSGTTNHATPGSKPSSRAPRGQLSSMRQALSSALLAAAALAADLPTQQTMSTAREPIFRSTSLRQRCCAAGGLASSFPSA